MRTANLHFIFLSFTILVCSYTQAQRLNSSAYVEEYHPAINSAELFVTEAKYPEALRLYEKAMGSVEFTYSKDYYNAMLCAAKSRRWKSCYAFADTLVRRGMNPAVLQDSALMAFIGQSKEWKGYTSTRALKVVPNSYDSSYKNTLNEMTKLDQYYRKKPGSYQVWGDSIRVVDSLNISRLKLLIDQRGFPGEKILGLQNPKDVGFPGYVVIHHHAQSMSLRNGKKFDFTPVFIEAVNKGQLDPYRFAYLISLQRNLDLGGVGVTVAVVDGKTSPLLGELYGVNRARAIDSTRATFGLCTMKDFYRKALFAIEDPKGKVFAFQAYGLKNIFELDNEEQYNEFLKASFILQNSKAPSTGKF